MASHKLLLVGVEAEGHLAVCALDVGVRGATWHVHDCVEVAAAERRLKAARQRHARAKLCGSREKCLFARQNFCCSVA